MSSSQLVTDLDEELQYSCFYLGDTLCGFDIGLVQEVNDDFSITKVPLSPEYVLGIMNLRGQIITVIDQSIKMGLQPCKIAKSSRVIIVKSRNEFIGLLVDRVGEVIKTNRKNIAKPPSNLKGVQGKFFTGIIHTESKELLGLLDIDTLLDDEVV